MSSGVRLSMCNTVVGTGAKIEVRMPGFFPKKVHLINLTSGDELMWNAAMADDTGFKRIAAGTGAKVTSGGVTPQVGGFDIGTDSDINYSGETIAWYAEE